MRLKAANGKSVLTGSEGEAEFLGLNLSDVLRLQFTCSLFAICHRFVIHDVLHAVRVLNHRLITAPFQQRLQLVTAGRHSFSLFQEFLRAAAQGELKREIHQFYKRISVYHEE